MTLLRRSIPSLIFALGLALPAASAVAQGPAADDPPTRVPKVVPVPPFPASPGPAPDPAFPPSQTVSDPLTHVTFDLPPAWNLARHDGELSTFHLDARTAPRRTDLRAVASLAFNPYPASTFASAVFYLSATPHLSTAACAAQVTFPPDKPLPPATVTGIAFSRGHDEHGHICTESRDVTYTAVHADMCLRFDLAVNTFCGGEVSGAKEITDAQLAAVFTRMESILATLRFR